MEDFEVIVGGAPNPYHRQIIGVPLPPYTPEIIPEPADDESSWVEDSSDYGVLAVDDSNQRYDVGEIDQANVERQLVEIPPQGSVFQRVCSNYASKNIRNLPTISDCSLDTSGMIGLAPHANEKNVEKQEEDEQDEETILISWDPHTGKLRLPERESSLNKGFANVERSRVQEGEQSAAGSNRMLLENVYVRQSSEEAAEAQAKLDTGVEKESKVENFLSAWDLVFANDE